MPVPEEGDEYPQLEYGDPIAVRADQPDRYLYALGQVESIADDGNKITIRILRIEGKSEGLPIKVGEQIRIGPLEAEDFMYLRVDNITS